MALYFITSSKSKFAEIKAIIPGVEHLEIDLPEIQELNPKKIIEYKLKHGLNHKQGEFIVDDVSFEMEALSGFPGPLVKWFEKAISNARFYEIAQKLGSNKAKVKGTIGYMSSKGEMQFFEGVVSGVIVEPRQDNGFGWDPIFMPDGFDKTYSQMTIEEKNRISHRGIAARKLKEYLDSI